MHSSARRIALLLLLAACGRGGARPAPPARMDSAAAGRDTAAADTEVVTERLGSPYELGVVTLSGPGRPEGTHRVRLNGRELWRDEVESVQVYALMQPPGGELVVLAITPGGTACEMMFRVLELRYQSPPRVSGEFGTCAAAPEVSWAGGRLRMFFEGWLPVRLAMLDTLPPGITWPPDQMVEYRDGRVDTVAVGRRADRLAGR